ncbi:GntR family transcriptional regulator [Caproicibacter sp.]|uniref:GntR family transcriptional regulator n=1 Tax=Caproicibacter sp. TaxID=2814884 RepID=UPI0039893BC0
MSDIPKYMTLVNWIRQKIESKELKYGDKLYSENELSSMFEISRQTIRQAIKLLEQEKLLESRQGSGTYVVFDPSARKPNMTIGVVTTYVGSYIFPNIIKGIEKVLTENGYSMQLAFTHNKVENERSVISSMLGKGVDGMIVEPTKSGLPNPNLDLYRKINEDKIPMIFINSFYPALDLPHVSLNDHNAGFLAADCLIRKGHRRIAGIFKLDDYQGHRRYAGYVDALIRSGLGLRDENVLWYSTEDFSSLSGDAKRILSRIDGCTSVVCYNDQIAISLVSLLKSRGFGIPDDVSLIGVDNSDLATLCEVPLTSVSHPKELLGETAARNLLHLISDPRFSATVEFKPELMERSSVKQL